MPSRALVKRFREYNYKAVVDVTRTYLVLLRRRTECDESNKE